MYNIAENINKPPLEKLTFYSPVEFLLTMITIEIKKITKKKVPRIIGDTGLTVLKNFNIFCDNIQKTIFLKYIIA